jgi:hypothetical protein
MTTGLDGQPVQVFEEDRADVMRRALPKLAVGLLGWAGIIALVVLVTSAGDAPLGLVLGLCFGIAVFALLLRFDVYALQFGRRIRYEVSDTEFACYRSDELVLRFELDRVLDWTAASPADTLFYWLGWGYYRSAALPLSLDTFSFTLRDESRRAGNRTVTPPALFRWEDRGGLRDLTHGLVRRLGNPVNYSINYQVPED